jgi:hypothetical protein
MVYMGFERLNRGWGSDVDPDAIRSIWRYSPAPLVNLPNHAAFMPGVTHVWNRATGSWFYVFDTRVGVRQDDRGAFVYRGVITYGHPIDREQTPPYAPPHGN